MRWVSQDHSESCVSGERFYLQTMHLELQYQAATWALCVNLGGERAPWFLTAAALELSCWSCVYCGIHNFGAILTGFCLIMSKTPQILADWIPLLNWFGHMNEPCWLMVVAGGQRWSIIVKISFIFHREYAKFAPAKLQCNYIGHRGSLCRPLQGVPKEQIHSCVIKRGLWPSQN